MKYKTWTIIILCLTLTALYLNSTTFLHFRLADHYMQIKDYNRAIAIYKKILRKESFNIEQQKFNTELIANLHFTLADLYCQKNMRNQAIEEYANAFHINPKINKPISIPLNELQDYKELAIAFLETGVWSKAIEYFSKMQKLIPQGRDMKIEKYILIATDMRTKNKHPVLNNDFYFSIGEQYIKEKLWNEARVFFTKRILKDVEPLAVLSYLDERYNTNNKSEIREGIWGEEIYVLLEDFEGCAGPVFTAGTGDTEPAVNLHNIAKGTSRSGNCSEYFDISYQKKGHYDYWVKEVNIPISRTNLSLGLRIFVKSETPFSGNLKVSIARQGVQQIVYSDVGRDMSGEWEILKVNNVSEKAKMKEARARWDKSETEIKGIIVDTTAVDSQFYIDDIELYITKSFGG